MEVNFEQVRQDPTKARYDLALMEELAAKKFKNDAATLAMLYKKFGAQWKDQCERSLVLAK